MNTTPLFTQTHPFKETHLRGESKYRTTCNLQRKATQVVRNDPSCVVCAAAQKDPESFREIVIPILRIGDQQAGVVGVHQKPGELAYYSFTPANPKGFEHAPSPVLTSHMSAMAKAYHIGQLWNEQQR